jgi:hypothetical protein
MRKSVLASAFVSIGIAIGCGAPPKQETTGSASDKVLVCLEGDCTFTNPPKSGGGHCLTPSERSDCEKHCGSVAPEQVDGCLEGCTDCDH